MTQFEESSSCDEAVEKGKATSPLREALSFILFTCSGDVTQYEETLSALEDSVLCYLKHLTQEATRCSENPKKIRSADVIQALKEYPQISNYLSSFDEESRSIQKEKKAIQNMLSCKY